MILEIHLSPETEAQIEAAAREQGIDAAGYVSRWVEQNMLPMSPEAEKQLPIDRNHFYFTASKEEWNQALDQIAEEHRGLPILPAEAFDREWLYADEDEIIRHREETGS